MKNLEDIRGKNQKTEKLSRDLSQSAEAQEILLRYIPVTQKEEEIIDNINYLSSREGISMYEISVKNKKTETVKTSVAETSGPFVSGAQGAVPSMGETSVQEVLPALAPENIEVKLGLAGTYDKIRSFSRKLSALRRFNSIDSMKISEEKETSGSEEKKSSAGILRVETVVTFNYMKKIASVANVNDRIFYSDKFNTSVVDNIKDKMNVSLVDLELKPGGRENPFIPN